MGPHTLLESKAHQKTCAYNSLSVDPDLIAISECFLECSRYIGLIAKIESSDSLPRLHEIVAVSDGAMVARGDLGAQIPLERVSKQLTSP